METDGEEGEVRQGAQEEEMTPERRQKIIDYQKAFLSAEGANVLADLSLKCYGQHNTYARGEPDESAFRAGQREVLIYIRRLVEAKPEEVEPMKARTEEDEENA